jgi:hypothetical protein
MRRILFLFMLLILLTTACSPQAAPTGEATESSDAPASTTVPTEPSSEETPVGAVEEATIEQLAENLGLKESEITVVSSEPTEFGDACLGVSMEGVMCAQVVTSGKTIVLEAKGIQYEYHTSEDGSRVQPASLALVWKREGGIAGFCDTLTIFRSGEVYANKCGKQAEGKMGTFATLMTDREVQQFQDWMAEFEERQLDASDPKGVADRMVVTVDIFGGGTTSPTESEQQDLFNFAQDLYQELNK